MERQINKDPTGETPTEGPVEKHIHPKLIKYVQTHMEAHMGFYFRGLFEVMGSLNVTFRLGGMPHPVHFREGMQIRNFMRQSGYCTGWNDCDYDLYWERVVLLAIGISWNRICGSEKTVENKVLERLKNND